MRCEICGKAVVINYGDAYHTLCTECSNTDNAQKILEDKKNPAQEKIATNDNVNIPMLGRTALVIVLIFGPILFLLYQLLKYKEELTQPIMVGIIAMLIIAEVGKSLYRKSLIGNQIIAQLVKSKLNNSLIFGITFLAYAIISGLLIEVKNINASYTYLLEEGYINSVLQLFNQEFMNNLEAHTFKNQHILPYYNTITVRHDLIGLLIKCVFLVIGIVNLRNGLRPDTFSKAGLAIDGKMLKWQKFTAYSWGKYYAKPTNKNPAGHYDLQLVRKNGKLQTYITGEKESPISLKIHAQDKDKVEQLLSNMIANSI